MVGRPDVPRTLADKLNHLFATVRPAGGGREYSNSEVATATQVSGSYIGYLRKGIRDNPSIETVQALARFFGVRPSYFVDEEQDEQHAAGVEAQLRLVRALSDPGIKRLAMRAAEADLSPTGLDAVAAMIEQVQLLERAAAQRRKRPAGPDPVES